MDDHPPTRGFRHWLGASLRGAGIAVLSLLLILGTLALVPAATGGLGADPDPADGYASAVARFQAIRATEADVQPACRSRLLSDGARAERVVVLFHGLTNCPRQMLELAEELHAGGASVLVLRAPGHGVDGGGVGDLSWVGAGDLRDYASGAVDIAEGLGDETTVVGLSLGGMLAAWAAQERTDVDRAVVVAPALALGGVPGWLSAGFTNAFTRLPNLGLPSGGFSAPHAYPPGIATRPTAEMFRLAEQVMQRAGAEPPPTTRLAMVLNDNDATVSNARAEDLVGAWRAHGRTVRVVHLPASLGLPHDTIDVAQPGQRTDVVYPIVVALAEGRPVPAALAAAP